MSDGPVHRVRLRNGQVINWPAEPEGLRIVLRDGSVVWLLLQTSNTTISVNVQ